jgi:hypothetical protein
LICLSKNLSDEFVNMFAKGSKLPIQDYSDTIPDDPVLIRSIMKKDLIQERLRTNKTFYYMDSGYVGNYPCEINPRGYKLFHRIVKNGLQHNEIIERPDDRWKELGQTVSKRKIGGRYILVVAPSAKPCRYYNVKLDNWISTVVSEIKKHTDRPIKIREKQPRSKRLRNTIYDDLNNCHALVTFNSIAAVESVLYGIPAFTLAPTAADPVCDKDLSLIENPTVNHVDKLHAWAHHLAYGQFHIDEFKSGKAWRILQKCE